MTEKEALQKVLDAAVELWAGDTRNAELREAIMQVINTTPQHFAGTKGAFAPLPRLHGLTDEDERA